MAPRLQQELERRLRAVVPFLELADATRETWAHDYGPLRDPGRLEDPSAPLTYVGIRRNEREDDLDLRDLLRGHEVAVQWGPDSLSGMLGASLAALAFQRMAPEGVAGALHTMLLAGPFERDAISPIRGLQVQSRAELAGVSFRAFNLEALATEFGVSAPVREQLAQRLPASEAGMSLVVARCKADDEVAAEVLRERVHAALPLLVLTREEDDFDWFYEGTVTFGAADTTLVTTLEAAEHPGSSYMQMIERSDIQVDGKAIETAAEDSPGWRRIAEAARALPTRPKDAMSRRLLRAAALLGESFSGTPNDRFLRRWMSMEALLGDRLSELSDRICERMAVITQDESEGRAERKRDLKQLYGVRSAIAHGADEPELASHTRTWFRMLCLIALRRAADAAGSSEKDLFERIDAAKFAGRAFA